MRTVKPFGPGAGDAPLRLHLCDVDPGVAEALAACFRDVDAAEVVVGDLLALRADALLSPANSFGYMDGGVDKRIDDFYRGKAQRAVRRRIAERWRGELPVGSADVLELPSARFRFLVVAPTMRVPGPIAGTIHAYLAFRAALAAALDRGRDGDPPITSLAATGLGTGVGAMSGEEAGDQMRAAYDMVVAEGWKRLAHPLQAPFVVRPRYLPTA